MSTTYQPKCHAIKSDFRGSRCGRPATFAERNGQLFLPVCNVHASGLRRRVYSRADIVVPITDDMLVVWEQQDTERASAKEAARAIKMAEQERLHKSWVADELRELEFTYSWSRSDKMEPDFSSYPPTERAIPTWIIVRSDGNTWNQMDVTVERRSSDAPFIVQMRSSNQLKPNAAAALAAALSEAAAVAANLNR